MPMKPISQILSITPLFHGLSEGQLDEIGAITVDRGYKRGEFIFMEGDEANGFYIVAEGQVENSRNSQIHMAAVDTVGICDFAQSGFGAGLDNVCKMVAAKLGKPFTEDDWAALGVRIMKAEREFNRNAGFTKEDDRLPKMFYEEPLPPHNKVVVISDEEMDKTFDF